MAHRLTLQRFARFLLAWYVAFVGVGTLSPLFKPVDLMLVCSASGAPGTDAGDPATTPAPAGHRHAIDCPLCLPLMAPPLARWSALPGHRRQPQCPCPPATRSGPARCRSGCPPAARPPGLG
jgi:hypothetical protein